MAILVLDGQSSVNAWSLTFNNWKLFAKKSMSEKFDHVFRLCCFSLSFLVWIISNYTNISSEMLTNWCQVFLCTCPLIDDKLHHKLTVWQLKVKLESLHYLKLYLPLLLLMIRMSQSACKKLDSYCRIFLCKKKLLRLKLTFNPVLAVTGFWITLREEYSRTENLLVPPLAEENNINNYWYKNIKLSLTIR